ncbi:MAG: hypothetical protein H7Y38_17230 [Armatimonadetes bacterium]|nr:hypothetical protein [Armatimonadota bacterium]
MPFEQAVRAVMEQNGVNACAIVDIETGECLARAGVTVTGVLETAGLVNARMLRAKMRFASDQHHETIEDVLITLDRHYHMIRLIACSAGLATMFIYVILDKTVANLALARRKVAEVQKQMVNSEESARQIDQTRLRLIGGELEPSKVYGEIEAFPQDDLPPFMRDDVAMRLLGIDVASEVEAVEKMLHDLAEREQ